MYLIAEQATKQYESFQGSLTTFSKDPLKGKLLKSGASLDYRLLAGRQEPFGALFQMAGFAKL